VDRGEVITMFPMMPKLSDLLKNFQFPETQFEDMVRSTVGIELPPGPSASVSSLIETLEETLPLPGELPRLPTLSNFPGLPFGGSSAKEVTTEQGRGVQPPANTKPAQRVSPPPRPNPPRKRGKVY